jgi:hypothetical protein
VDAAGDGAVTWIYLPGLVPVLVGGLASTVVHQYSSASSAKAVVNCSDKLFHCSKIRETDDFCLFVLRIK